MGEQHRDARSGTLWEPLDEHATFRLGIDYGFRGAFTQGAPMTREEYEFKYFHTPAGAYFSAPSYEEYLRLYERYSDTCRARAAGLSDREAADLVRGRIEPPT